jgi:hypothetical protein
MYAEQAHRHLADANFYFFQDKDFFRSRAEGAPLGRHLGYFARGKNPGLATRSALAKLRFDLSVLNTKTLVELSGIEPLTPCLQSRCSPS